MIIGRLANNWNIPIFTYAGTSEVLANKTEFRTLTRLSFSLTLCAQFYVEVFKVSLYERSHDYLRKTFAGDSVLDSHLIVFSPGGGVGIL